MNQPALLKEQPHPQPVESAGITPNHSGLVGLTTRVRPIVSTMLFRAAMERKMQRRNAASMQEIVDEALTE